MKLGAQKGLEFMQSPFEKNDKFEKTLMALQMNHRILIVDDAPENIELLTGLLTHYHRSVALDGEKALEIAFSNNPPDLVLLDINMPGMDGFEVIRRLKEDERTREIPVIFLTVDADTESIVRGFTLGAADYVTKPFKPEELLARVNTHLALKESRERIERHSREIERKNRKISDSIQYASRIQGVVLPDMEDLSRVIGEHFILYLPRDVVSGDFYLVREIEGRVFIVVADSTGHGVPGAFMSMMGVALINEILTAERIHTPSMILDRLRKLIIQSLHQDSSKEIKDGMDMAILAFDPATSSAEFAGAHHSLLRVRGGELKRYRGDRMPVSIHLRMDPFTNHPLRMEKGDCYYFYSDGFPDQFGGPENSKFSMAPFFDLILQNSGKPMNEQHQALSRTFDAWKGDQDQVDDVLVLGFRY